MAREIGKHRAKDERAFHMVNIESLAAVPLTPERVRDAWSTYTSKIPVARDDAVVVGVSKRNAQAAAFGLPSGVRLVVGKADQNGADAAIDELVDVRHASRRYERFYLTVGETCFATIGRQLAAVGHKPTCIS